MIFCVQIILIIILLSILILLYLDEKQKKKAKVSTGKLTQVWDGSERRRFLRVPTDIPVRYSLPKNSNNLKNGRTKDISIGGICMTVNEKLNPKVRLCLEIESEGSPPPISAKGEVVWVKEAVEQKNAEGIRYFDIGIEFKDISPKDKERLAEFIKRFECGQSG